MTAMPTPDENIEVSSETKKLSRKKKLIIVLSLILVFIITLVSSFFIMVKLGEIRLKNSLVSAEKVETQDSEDSFDVIYHNGKKYKYNDNLINLLLIGVDEYNDKEVQGQADALYLVSVDNEADKVKIISISRNTMCDFDTIGIDGKDYSTEHGQICLAYAYGNDDIQSSKNCVKAVSDLLYGVPINGYYTIHLDAIKTLVDAVGGVNVTITQNDADTKYSDSIGKTLTLNGETAYRYIRTRGNSNGPRVERHKEFISGFINSAKRAVSKDLTLPFKLANEMKKYSVTDINLTSAVYLATEALNWQIDFVNLKGEYAVEDGLETYTVDETELKNMIIGNFYIEK